MRAHLTVRDLHIGTNKLDIRFWREGEETALQVIKGDPTLVDRCNIASKTAELRAGCDMIAAPQASARAAKGRA
jgi:hypothetical protein